MVFVLSRNWTWTSLGLGSGSRNSPYSAYLPPQSHRLSCKLERKRTLEFSTLTVLPRRPVSLAKADQRRKTWSWWTNQYNSQRWLIASRSRTCKKVGGTTESTFPEPWVPIKRTFLEGASIVPWRTAWYTVPRYRVLVSRFTGLPFEFMDDEFRSWTSADVHKWLSKAELQLHPKVVKILDHQELTGLQVTSVQLILSGDQLLIINEKRLLLWGLTPSACQKVMAAIQILTCRMLHQSHGDGNIKDR